MQIVIDIPEDEYGWIKKSDNTAVAALCSKECMLHAIKNGTPLTERPNGRWIKCKSRFGVEYFKCSECGRRLDWIDRDDNYCSNCGSDNSESTKEWFNDLDTKLAEMSGGEEE